MRYPIPALVLTLSFAASCGFGPGPTVPALPASASAARATQLAFASGETQRPVASAQVVIDGRSYVTDAHGRITLESAPAGGALLDVQAEGFLHRRAPLSGDRFTLWPSRSPTGLDEELTARMVYACGAGQCAGGQPLYRVLAAAVRVVPSAELAADAAALEAHQAAAEALSRGTRGEVAFTVAPSGGAGGGLTVATRVDPADPSLVALGAAAVTRRGLGPRGEIAEASVVFRSVDLARRMPLVLHELGHVFGLDHSPRAGDVMFNGPQLYDTPGLSSRETLAIALMLQRMPGNRFPDVDAGAAAAAVGGTSTIACARP